MTTNPAAFYKNYIEPFATEWVSCSPVIKNGGFDKAIKTTTVMTPFYMNKVYSFLLVVEGKRYWYLFQPLEFLSRKIIFKRPSEKNPLPPKQSHLYLEEAMKILTLYREPLNEFTLVHLDQRLANMTRVPVFNDFFPTFFHQNLLWRTKENASCLVTKPGSSENPQIRCLIRPVYGPSHNPLSITIGNEEIRLLFLEYSSPLQLRKSEPNEIIINMDSYYGKSDATPLVILDLISMIASLELEMISREELMKKIREIPVLRKKQLIDLSQSRSDTLEKDIYWTCRLFQTTQKKTPLEENAKAVKLMVEDLRLNYAVVENEEERQRHIVNTVKNMMQDYRDLFPLQS